MTKGVVYTEWPLAEGYCWPHSYLPGETVSLRCSSRVDRFSVTVTRVGAHRDLVWERDNVSAEHYDVSDDAWQTGCDWPVAVAIPVEPDWPSGFYEVAMIVDPADAARSGHRDGHPGRLRSEAFFVIRSGEPPGDRAVLVLSTNTYNAYNQWGGRCLYSGADRVSFARPVERGYLRRPAAPFDVDFDGRMASVESEPDREHRRLQRYQAEGRYPLWTNSAGWHNWERRFVRWAESEGIELDYAVNADLQFVPELLDGRRQLVSVGHDEYWSRPMRNAVDSFVDTGGRWAIFGGNTMFWQVRLEDEGRTMVCYKSSARSADPLAGGPISGSSASGSSVSGSSGSHLMTGLWSDPKIGYPENLSTGLSFTRGGYYRVGDAVADGSGTYVVHQPGHWAFADTGLTTGDELGSGSFVVGYEVDGCALKWIDDGAGAVVPVPTGQDGTPVDVDILATAPARLISITEDRCEAPEALWAGLDPPGDLEFVAEILFGDASPESVAEIAQGHAVMSVMRRGSGLVFNAGTTDWAYGLDKDPVVQQVTRNVMGNLSGSRSIAANSPKVH